MAAARFLVSGKVQGVFYRVHTRERAQALGLQGHALNLDDGRVEVIVAGPAEAIDRLQDWLHEGPPAARVTGVERHGWDGPVEPGFVVG